MGTPLTRWVLRRMVTFQSPPDQKEWRACCTDKDGNILYSYPIAPGNATVAQAMNFALGVRK